MKRYTIAPEARSDLIEIGNYIRAENPRAAEQQIERFYNAFQQLGELPGMGRSQEQRGPNLRSWTVGGYLVFYRPSEDGIDIVRVIHGRRKQDDLI